jgi:membrane protein
VSLLGWLDSITLPGFEGNSLFKVGRFFFKSAFDEHLNLRTSYLAYNFFLALFPTIIFLFTAIAYLPIKNLDVEIMNQLKFILPNNVYTSIQSTIKDIINHQRGSLLSFGFITAIFFSSNGFLSMIRAFNRSKKKKPHPYKDRIKSILLTFLIFIILIVSLTVIVYTTLSINWFRSKKIINGEFWTWFYLGFEYITLIFLLYLIFSSLYFIGSSLTFRWKFFSPGSTLSTFLSFFATESFAYYVNHFDSYNKLYGSIGTIISLMLLIYFNSMIILIGFELNFSIYLASKEKKLERGLE